jgi:hypothetical protein
MYLVSNPSSVTHFLIVVICYTSHLRSLVALSPIAGSIIGNPSDQNHDELLHLLQMHVYSKGGL